MACGSVRVMFDGKRQPHTKATKGTKIPSTTVSALVAVVTLVRAISFHQIEHRKR